MLASIFLIPYLGYVLTKTIESKTKKIRLAGFFCLIVVSFSFITIGINFIKIYQNTYKESFILPQWIGQPSDVGKTILSCSNIDFINLRLLETGLKVIPIKPNELSISKFYEYEKDNFLKYIVCSTEKPEIIKNKFEPLNYTFQHIVKAGDWLNIYEICEKKI